MTTSRVRSFIGLGSNLDNPVSQVQRAIRALGRMPQSDLVGSSSLYRSEPLGPPDQPDYINAVAALDTSLAPRTLLEHLQQIEQQQGRVRDATRWGPRTIDLDLLLYGVQQINEAGLEIPHPGIASRAFVLYPLQELAPILEVPGLGPMNELISCCPALGIEKL